jgi:hypothetical protein
MDHMKRAAEALEQAETSLRDIVAKAAGAGDYQTVVQIASWASTISEMFSKAGGWKRTGQIKAVAVATTAKRKAPRSNSENGYPKFFRQDDQLIRVAWSKREKSEYQHKTSYAVVQAVALAMAKSGKDGRVFSTKDCLPVQDPAGGGDIPSYQAYVVIALSKQAGLIEQHGRQGYSIPRDAEFKVAVEAFWKKLPTK